MGYDTGIADRLRAAGVRVVEIDAWQSRGSSSFGPGGSVNHHTAGGASGSCPSLNTCIYGRPDLPGPLCNVMQSREPDGNDIAYVIAAGRANHAGSGGWRGLSGNSSVYGLEIEHTGTSPLPDGRQWIAARIHAAMFGGDPGMVCQHYEWTSRKIDAATNVDGNAFRNLVAQALAGTEDDMPYSEAQIISMCRSAVHSEMCDTGTATRTAIMELAQRAVAAEMSTTGSTTRSALMKLLKDSIQSEAGDLNQALDVWARNYGVVTESRKGDG